VPTIFGEPTDTPLLGVTALEILGYAIDPRTRKLGSSQMVSSTGSGNVRPSLAPLPATGPAAWVATWRSGNAVEMRLLDSAGAPLAGAQGAEQIVSSTAQAEREKKPIPSSSVASLPDGRFAIVWAGTALNGGDGGDIFLQRYGADGQPIPGDATVPINDQIVDGIQSLPAIAAEPSAGGSYVVAWIDEASGHVRGRFIGGSAGFLFNHVDGQETEFQASVDDGRQRTQPAVAVGGKGPWVAIGWQDATGSTVKPPGIYGRRFPMGE